MVLRLLITEGWLDPAATAHEAAESCTGLRTLSDRFVISAAEALLWCGCLAVTFHNWTGLRLHTRRHCLVVKSVATPEFRLICTETGCWYDRVATTGLHM